MICTVQDDAMVALAQIQIRMIIDRQIYFQPFNIQWVFVNSTNFLYVVTKTDSTDPAVMLRRRKT